MVTIPKFVAATGEGLKRKLNCCEAIALKMYLRVQHLFRFLSSHFGLLFGCFCVLVAVQSSAQNGLDTLSFTRGKWIGPVGNGSEVGVFRFRRELSVPTIPEHFMIRISADSQFILSIDGRRVAYGPSKGDLYHWRYAIVDLAPFLKAGTNEIDVLVWKYPDGVMLSQISRRIGLLIEAEDPGFAAIDTDTRWKVEPAIDRGFINASYSRDLHGYYAAAPGEIVHWGATARLKWMSAQIIGRAALRGERDASTPWMLEPDLLPPMDYNDDMLGFPVRSYGPIQQHGDAFIISPHSHASILLDHRELTTGYPILDVSSGIGSKFTVTYAEALYGNVEKGNRNQIEGKQIRGMADYFYIDGPGSATLQTLNWRAWRYVQIDVETGEEEVRIDKTSSIFTAYPFRMRAAFEASDKSLEEIWEIGWRTARLDAHDTYMDTPYWERLQYVGDTRIQALISYAMANDDRLARQAIDAIDSSRFPDGFTQSRYPSALVQVIPPFSLLWVGMLDDFWWYRDDDAFVRSHLPGTRAILGWFLTHQKPDGLLDQLPWWNFVDVTPQFKSGVPPQESDGHSALLTLQFIEALQYAAEMERELGSPLIASEYDKARLKAVTAVRSLCWDAQMQMFADTSARKQFSQQTNALAVMLGVAMPAQRASLIERILGFDDRLPLSDKNISEASYYFRFYLSRALESAHLGNRYLQTLTPWRDMMSAGLTTWAEEPEPSRSDSHAWSAHPNFDLLRIVAGIKPAKPRFAAVTIEPHPGSLESFKASYPHVLGTITVAMRRRGNLAFFDVALPAGLPGSLRWKGYIYPLRTGTQHLHLSF